MTPEQANSVIAVINEEVFGDATRFGGSLSGQNFCTIWPNVQPVLGMAALVLGFMPNGIAAAALLNGLIKVGQAAYAAGCQTPSS